MDCTTVEHIVIVHTPITSEAYMLVVGSNTPPHMATTLEPYDFELVLNTVMSIDTVAHTHTDGM